MFGGKKTEENKNKLGGFWQVDQLERPTLEVRPDPGLWELPRLRREVLFKKPRRKGASETLRKGDRRHRETLGTVDSRAAELLAQVGVPAPFPTSSRFPRRDGSREAPVDPDRVSFC